MNMYRCVRGNGIFGIFANFSVNFRKTCKYFLIFTGYIFHNGIFTVAIHLFGILFA